jgi:hypothetical protein
LRESPRKPWANYDQGPRATSHELGESRNSPQYPGGFSDTVAGLKKSELGKLKKSDWRKRVIGRLVRRSTVMPVAWIAEPLQLGDPKRAATLVQSDPNPSWGKDWNLG